MTRENVASHLQKYRAHLKMLGASANLSPDEMMALHVNGEASEAGGERRWNEGDNRPRWPSGFVDAKSPGPQHHQPMQGGPAVQLSLWALPSAAVAVKPPGSTLLGLASTSGGIRGSSAAMPGLSSLLMVGGTQLGHIAGLPAGSSWPPQQQQRQRSFSAAEPLHSGGTASAAARPASLTTGPSDAASALPILGELCLPGVTAAPPRIQQVLQALGDDAGLTSDGASCPLGLPSGKFQPSSQTGFVRVSPATYSLMPGAMASFRC
jgi:hypothetical protein